MQCDKVKHCIIISMLRRLKGDRDDPAAALWMSVKLEDPVPGLHHSWLSVNGIRLVGVVETEYDL